MTDQAVLDQAPRLYWWWCTTVCTRTVTCSGAGLAWVIASIHRARNSISRARGYTNIYPRVVNCCISTTRGVARTKGLISWQLSFMYSPSLCIVPIPLLTQSRTLDPELKNIYSFPDCSRTKALYLDLILSTCDPVNVARLLKSSQRLHDPR